LRAINTVRGVIGAIVRKVEYVIACEVKRLAFKVCKMADSHTPNLGNFSAVLELLRLGGE
jgi:hypothetical protein